MPPRISFTREKIINAAAQIVSREGVDKLNARSVAHIMNGSTQPIYRVFTSIEELENAVIEKLSPMALKYMLDEVDEESAFLSIGLGYLKFARRHPWIYDLLFVKGKKKWDLSANSPFIQPILAKMRRDIHLTSMSDSSLVELFREMFIYTHGLCTLRSIDSDHGDPARDRRLLHDMGGKLIVLSMIRERNPEILENIERSVKL